MPVFVLLDTSKHAKSQENRVLKKSQKVYDEKINMTDFI